MRPAQVADRASRSAQRGNGIITESTHTRSPARTARGVLLAWTPLLIVFALDTFFRLQLAALLELHHDDATRAAAVPAALLGATRDLAWVLPAWVIWALLPRALTRLAVHIALVAALAILAADLVYFYQTFEHVEPVLFVNFNWLSIRSTVGPRDLAWLVIGGLGLALLARANEALLKRAGDSTPRRARLAAVSAPALVVACAIAAGPAVRVPLGESSLDQLLNTTRNSYLGKVAAPVIGQLFHAIAASRHIEAERLRPEFEAYTDEERSLLAQLGLPEAAFGRTAQPQPAPFTRIVLLVLESLPSAYLHHYNERVPPEATPFLDELIARYPHFDRYYTANMPSDWGLNSMFLSRLRPEWQGRRPSLLSVLREARGFESYYVRGVSKHYGNELATYPRLFQMDHYYAFEELDERYDEPWHSAWGFNNEVVYAEGLRILRENRDRNVVVVLKTIDLHQPGPFEGVPHKYLPPALQKLDVGLFNALHWADGCVRRLFDALVREDLYDDRTLVVVTSDHTPQPGLAYKQTVPAADYERLGRIPLILASPNEAALAHLDVGSYASQLDLAPTLLALLGVDEPDGFQGRSLIGPETQDYRIGVYRDTFYYGSPELSFSEPVGDDEVATTLRNRTIRKWLRNQDADLPSDVARIAGTQR